MPTVGDLYQAHKTKDTPRFGVEQSEDRLVITIRGSIERSIRKRLLLWLALAAAQIAFQIWLLTRIIPRFVTPGADRPWAALVLLMILFAVWIWSGLAGGYVFLQRVAGTEILELTPTDVHVTWRVLWFEKRLRFPLDEISDLNLVNVEPEGIAYSRSGRRILALKLKGQVRFKIPGRSVHIGLDLEDRDALALIRLVKSHLLRWGREKHRARVLGFGGSSFTKK